MCPTCEVIRDFPIYETTAMEGMPAVGAIEYGISRLSTFSSVVALVAGGVLVAWVIGLLIILRGSKPDERSVIIYAYAHCNPIMYLRRNTAPRGGGSARQHSPRRLTCGCAVVMLPSACRSRCDRLRCGLIFGCPRRRCRVRS